MKNAQILSIILGARRFLPIQLAVLNLDGLTMQFSIDLFPQYKCPYRF